jgi:hypothetical protein
LEFHDSFFAVRAEREPMFECFVDNCTVKSKGSVERIAHLVAVHQYPKNFEFSVIQGERDVPSKKKKNRERRDAMEIDEITTKMGQLMVPRTVRFQHKPKRS